MKQLIKFGNSKLPKTTMIFNMSSSKSCSSRLLGLCPCASYCYARKPEKIYLKCLPYRERQAEYWLNNSATEIFKNLKPILKRKKIKIKYFRFNEAGDFYTQGCVDKLSLLAGLLLAEFGIVTYGYTARSDLDFSNASFLVKGSSNNAGNNGRTVIINSIEQLPDGYQVCVGDCNACDICATTNKNIAFIRH